MFLCRLCSDFRKLIRTILFSVVMVYVAVAILRSHAATGGRLYEGCEWMGGTGLVRATSGQGRRLPRFNPADDLFRPSPCLYYLSLNQHDACIM